MSAFEGLSTIKYTDCLLTDVVNSDFWAKGHCISGIMWRVRPILSCFTFVFCLFFIILVNVGLAGSLSVRSVREVDFAGDHVALASDNIFDNVSDICDPCLGK